MEENVNCLKTIGEMGIAAIYKSQDEELSKSEDILLALSRSLGGVGFAGNTQLPELIWLCMITRLFEKPVSLVIKGSSGSGKSFALNQAMKFVPSSAYESFSGMSEKALIYNKLNLKNKYLIIQEAAGLSHGEGRAYLRQLLSEGEVRYMTVQNTPNGNVGQELPRVQGPTGLMMTTTANSLHPEDESRMLSYHVDESPEQMREALRCMTSPRPSVDPKVFEPWHELHETIANKPLDVSIPFADRLAEALPTTHHRVKRDLPQVLSLIRANALLHSCTRPQDDDGRIVAEIADYASVYRLVADTISQGLEAAVPHTVRDLVNAVKTLQNSSAEGRRDTFGLPEIGVSQRQLAEFLNRDASVISRHCAAAIKSGYLVDRSPGQGRESALTLGDRALPEGYALPHPDGFLTSSKAITKRGERKPLQGNFVPF